MLTHYQVTGLARLLCDFPDSVFSGVPTEQRRSPNHTWVLTQARAAREQSPP